MAVSKRGVKEPGLEFELKGFAKCYHFSEGSFKPKKDTQVIRVREEGHNSNYLF